MSYNVSRWVTKELVDLRIPVASFFKHDRKDWHPQRVPVDDGTTAFQVGEDCYIGGNIVNDVLHVTEVTIQGEGSGTALHWIFEPALADSTGRLVAVRVWEGGDSIDRLVVDNGTVTHEDIEI